MLMRTSRATWRFVGGRHWASLFLISACIPLVAPVVAQTYDIATAARTVENGDGGQAINALLLNPRGIAVAGDGTVYVSQPVENIVRRIATNGAITTYAGNGGAGFGGCGPNSSGPATNLRFCTLAGIATDALGNLYVVEEDGNSIWRIGNSGAAALFAGTGNYLTPGI